MIEDKSIDLESIMNIIQSQLSVLVNLPENAELFAGVRLICSLEQQFMKIKDKDRHAIYIVVRLGASSVVFGQTVLPVTIMALTEENKIELTRNLLMQYALTFNLNRVNDDTIQQVYEAPNVISNFEAVYSGYRSVINVSGVFVVSPHVNFYNLWYYQNLAIETADLYSSPKTLVFNTAMAHQDIDDIIDQLIPTNGTKTILQIGDINISIYKLATTREIRLKDIQHPMYSSTSVSSNWRYQSVNGATFTASDGVLRFDDPTATVWLDDTTKAIWSQLFLDLPALKLANNQYYMQYRDPALPTYKAGKFYKWTGTAFVAVDDTTVIGDNYDEEDLYVIDTSDLVQNSYYLQTPTYPVAFETGSVYWYINGEFLKMRMDGAKYIPNPSDMADPTQLTGADDAGYYIYTGDSQFYGDDYFQNGAVYYWDGTSLAITLPEQVPAFTISFGLVNSADTQAFYNTNDFTKSTIRFGAANINLTTFVLSTSPMIDKVIDMITERNGVSVNESFLLGVQFKDGRTRFKPSKLVTIGASQDLGQIPSLVLSFAE